MSGQVTPRRAHLGRKAPALPADAPPALQAALPDLVAASLRIESIYGRPMDIEWCVDGDGLHILQARPITAYFGPGIDLWCSSNIGENYPDALSPFTWSVVDRFRRGYFESLAGRLLIPAATVRRWRPTLAHLLGVQHGQVHYNLGSWYRMLGQVPGGALLARAFDRYIDQRVPEPDDVRRAGVEAPGAALRWRIRAGLVTSYATVGRRLDAFERRFAGHRRRWDRALAEAGAAGAAGADGPQRADPARLAATLCDILDSRAQTVDALTKLDLPAGVDVEIKVQ
jgi:hypothetical protein